MGLNNEQLQAVNSNSDRILCLAGAGAGKTKCFIERIARLVGDGVAPESILALTFTNAAAAEMKSRYEAKQLKGATPEFRTFHAFCYSLLCKDSAIRGALGYTTVPEIASEEQEKSIAERAKAQCKITISDEKLNQREGLSKQEQFQAELYDKAVNRIMHQEDVITFDKLNSAVSDLFASGHFATEPYKQQYKYIFTDEFQDTDQYQIKFLNSFPNTNFYFCGDTLQEIYRFRGTSNEFIKALANSDGWEKIRLFTNYRSTNQICEYANKFSVKYADPSYRIEMQGTRDGERVITKLVNGPTKYQAIDPRDINDVLSEREHLSGTSAILCRTNKEVAAVVSHLRKLGVEFTTSKDTKAQKLIECALSDTYMLELMASYLSSNKYGEYIRLATKFNRPNLDWFMNLYGNTPQIKEDAEKIAKLNKIANGLTSTEVKLDEVYALLGIRVPMAPEAHSSGRLFLEYLRDTVSEIKSSELYVGTIHSVKGLEYDNVFVMNVGSYSFRLKNEEMKNLFYVAVTRAKNRLYVYELFE